MRYVWTIALNTVRVTLADKSNLFGLFFLPIMMVMIIGFAFRASGQGKIRIDVLDQDQTPDSDALISALREANDQLYFCPLDLGQEGVECDLKADVPYTLELGQKRVSDQDTRSLIVIPEGYGETFNAFQPISISYYTLASLASGEDVVQTALDAALQRVNGAVIAAQVGLAAGDSFGQNGNPSIFKDEVDRTAFTRTVYESADELLKAVPIKVETVMGKEPVGSRSDNPGFGQSVPGMGSMFVMFTVFAGIAQLLRERKQWTLQRLATLPLQRWHILGGKMLAYFILGITQYVIVFIVGFLTGTQFGNSPIALLLLMMAFTFCITALTFALATQLKTEQQAQGVTLLISMTLAPLGGAWWPLSITPPFMQTLGHLSPIAWVMDGFRNVIFFGGGIADVIVPMAVLLVMSAVFFVIGVWGFKYE